MTKVISLHESIGQWTASTPSGVSGVNAAKPALTGSISNFLYGKYTYIGRRKALNTHSVWEGVKKGYFTVRLTVRVDPHKMPPLQQNPNGVKIKNARLTWHMKKNNNKNGVFSLGSLWNIPESTIRELSEKVWHLVEPFCNLVNF